MTGVSASLKDDGRDRDKPLRISGRNAEARTLFEPAVLKSDGRKQRGELIGDPTPEPLEENQDRPKTSMKSTRGRVVVNAARKEKPPSTAPPGLSDPYNVSDESKVSKQIRRLMREDNFERFQKGVQVLQESILLPENGKYIRRNLETLLNAMLDLSHAAPGLENRQQVALAIGKAGYISEHDLGVYLDWCLEHYKTEISNKGRLTIIESINELLRLENELPQLKNAEERLMVTIQQILEVTDAAELLKPVVHAVLLLLERENSFVPKYFHDMVDILVGWHVDPSQPKHVSQTAGDALSRMGPFWLTDKQATVTLLAQFLEDTSSLPVSEADSDPEARRLALLVRVFNTVTTSVIDHLLLTGNTDMFGSQFLNTSITRMVEISLEILEKEIPEDDLLAATNDTAAKLLPLLTTKNPSLSNLILSYITAQLPASEKLSFNAVVSFLRLFSSTVLTISLFTTEDVHSWLNHDSPILRLRFLPHGEIVKSALALYHSFLALKNVHLLEEAYKQILSDFEVSLETLGSSPKWVENNTFPKDKYDGKNAELVALFAVNALSELASASNSIIVMWALKPSVFEIFTDILVDKNVCVKHPMILLASMKLVKSHCKKHNQFAPSSVLLTGKPSGHILPNQSPTAGYFEKIIDIVTAILADVNAVEVVEVALSWAVDILTTCVPYMKVLHMQPAFKKFIQLALSFVTSPAKSVVVIVADFLEMLFHAASISQDIGWHKAVVEGSLLHSANVSAQVRDRCSQILLKYPPVFVKHVASQVAFSGSFDMRSGRRSLLTKLSPVTLPAVYFTSVMQYILKAVPHPDEPWLENVFAICWENSLEVKIRNWCENNEAAIMDWSLWEAATFCVSNKLRTPLGKPNETFLTIENAVKNLAFELDGKNDSIVKNLGLLTLKETAKPSTTLLDNCKKCIRAGLLVTFVDHLERSLYNAYEGTAIVLPAPLKVIRLFFRTNRSTCEEWLLRLRRTLAPLALEAGMWESAYRHASYWLRDLVSKNLEEHPDFEKAVICCAEALRRRGDSLSLAGLYDWLRSGLKYNCDWIQGLIQVGSGKLEDGMKTLAKDLERLREKLQASIERSETEKLQMDVNYLEHQIELCRHHLGSWDGMESENSSLSQYGKASLLFHEGQYAECAKTLSLIKGEAIPWKYSAVEFEIQKELMKAACQFGEGPGKFEELHQAVSLFGEAELVKENFDEVLESLHVLRKLELIQQQHPVLTYPVSSIVDPSTMGTSSRGLSAIRWVRHLVKVTGDPLLMAELSNFEGTALKLARKEKNFELARTLICDRVKHEMGLQNIADNGTLALLITVMANCRSSYQKSDIVLQGTKLLYECGDIIPSVTLLSQTCIELRRHIPSFGISSMLRLEPAVLEEEAAVKKIYIASLIQLSKWLGSNKYLLSNSGNSYMQEAMVSLVGGLPPVQLVGRMDEGDACVGQILQAGIRDVQENAKAWKRYGDWCYDHGSKALQPADGFGFLNEADVCAVAVELESFPTEEKEQVLQLLSKSDEGSGESAVISIDSMRQRLTGHSSLKQNGRTLESLLLIWEAARNRVFGYYRQAVGSYFEFLKLDLQLSEPETSQAENVVAALRILDMLVKHPLEMSSVFELSVRSTSAESWKRITPQLLARLAYPDPIVRKNLSDLLLKIGASHPELLIFPAVVGAEAVLESRASKKDNGLLRDLLSQASGNGEELDAVVAFDSLDDDEVIEDENPEDCSAMKSSFDLILSVFAKEVPEMLAEVRLLTQELRRIVLLWDELWLATLNQYHSQIVKNINRLELELEKVKLNASLTKEDMEDLARKKYDIIFKPILLVFETLHSVSSVEPSTPHEKWFHDKYAITIEEGLASMRSPKDPWKPMQAWTPFKQLYASLQARSQRKNASHLKLKDISPRLSELRDTKIVLPGKTSVTIAALDDTVLVLPTKTRPKKLIFRGNDSASYGYLFKGLEDLHLDERVMQILEITNTMLASSKAECGKPSEYRARHYAVVPLGARSGLIQWVPDVTPLFGLYKRWQQREATITQSKAGANPATVNVPRPSELFYAKLGPALLAEGISPTPEHRKEWPVSILVNVLGELMKETPADLLAREIWCNSPSSREWWRSTQNFARYTAVMSMIGHVIGLGDRHLDNILVNLSTGEVVHIDYNVCFEKGLQLRVPEVVPFRLTSNIQTALGPTGIEGIFRHSCEHVMSVLRSGKETLLTLLEAFLYDPLIDWLADAEHGYAGIFHCINPTVAKKFQTERRELDRELTHTMFDVRIAEIQSDWFENKEETMNLLPKLREALEVWIENSGSIERHEDRIQELQQAMALIKEAEVNPDHSLYSIYPAYMQYKVVLDGEQNMRKALQEKLVDVNRWAEIEEESLEALQGPDWADWAESLRQMEELAAEPAISGFSIATDFLAKAGQAGMVTQCEQAEAKVKTALQKCSSSCRTLLEILAHYGNISTLYPSETRQNHRSFKYRQWLEMLADRIDIERYNAVRKSFEAEYGNESRDLLLSQSALSVAQAMRTAGGELSSRLQSLQSMNLQAELAASELELARSRSNLEHILLNGALGRANKAILSVILSTMSGLNKKNLNLEATIANFVDMGLGNTASFVIQSQCSVDEMLMQNLVANEVLSVVDRALDPGVGAGLTEVAEKQLLALRGVEEMFYKCRSVVLPEALRRCQMGDSSVYAIFSTMSEVVDTSAVSLNELTDVLELHLRYRVMEMESPVTPLVGNVTVLRNAFSAMIEKLKKEEISQGEMLLLGLNGLCLSAENLALSAISSLLAVEEKIPPGWRKIDIVRDAKAIAPPIFSATPRDVLRDLIFVQRLKLIHQTLALCIENGLAFRLPSIGHIGPDIRDLLEKSRLQPVCHTFTELEFPIRKYGLEILRRQLFGITTIATTYSACFAAERMGFNLNQFIGKREVGADSTVSFDEICQSVIEDVNGATKAMSSSLLAQGVGHVATLEAEIRKYETLRSYEKNIEADRAALAQWEVSTTAFHWLYEDILNNPAVSPASPTSIQSRASLLHELMRIQKSLKIVPAKITELVEQTCALGSSIEQRLKWAAGANPAVAEQLEQFSVMHHRALGVLNDVKTLVEQLITASSGIVHFENMRTRSKEAVESDAEFAQLLQRCKEVCLMSESCPTHLTAAEIGLLRLVPPDHPIDLQWIQKAESVVSSSLRRAREKLNELNLALQESAERVRADAAQLRENVSDHHNVISSMRALLKQMGKMESNVQNYLAGYRSYSELCSIVVKSLSAELDTAKVCAAKEALENMESKIADIYDLLPKLTSSSEQDAVAYERMDSKDKSDAKHNSKDVHSGRNSVAITVWRKVKLKLEGKEFDPDQPYSVKEQVDAVIKDATNIENLALLYEGWTPWV